MRGMAAGTGPEGTELLWGEGAASSPQILGAAAAGSCGSRLGGRGWFQPRGVCAGSPLAGGPGLFLAKHRPERVG